MYNPINQIHTFIDAFTWSSVWSNKTAFSMTPPSKWEYKWFYVAFGVICLLFGIYAIINKKIYTPYREQLLNFFWTNFTIAVILFFLRDQRIPLLGMDFLRTLHIFAALFWGGMILLYRLTAYKKDQLTLLVVERRNKYLPKSKEKTAV